MQKITFSVIIRAIVNEHFSFAALTQISMIFRIYILPNSSDEVEYQIFSFWQHWWLEKFIFVPFKKIKRYLLIPTFFSRFCFV